MTLVKKKEIQIFSDGSFNIDETIIRKAKKIKIFKKDHLTFSFNKKETDFKLNSEEFENFKTKYFKF